METPAGGRCWRGFTLVEMLVVIMIIVVLAAILVPTIGAARRRVKVGVAKTELAALTGALTLYFSDWGEYPPDQTDNAPEPSLDSAQCLVYYLRGPDGAGFRTSDGFSRNGGPYFEFPPDRLVGPFPRFLDALGARDGDTCYRYDNNDADQGGEDWGADPTGWNVTNVHPTSVDLWCTGWDGIDEVLTVHPTQSDPSSLEVDLEDAFGNW